MVMDLLKAAGIAALSGVCAAACSEAPRSGQHGQYELDHSSLRPVQLRGRVLASGDYLAAPTEIALVGDRLLVVDAISDSVLHVIDAREGRHLRSLGRRGEGPGEYRSPWSVARQSRTPDQPWIYDLQLARLTRVHLGSAGLPAGEAEIIRIQGEALATQPVWVHDSLLVSPSFSHRGRLAFFGADGAFRRAAGPLPAGNGGVPAPVLQHAWTGTLVSNPRTGWLALATRHADQVEIYRPDGTLVRKVRGPFRFDPRFTVEVAQGQQVMGSGDAMRFGYVDVEATPEEIFALFSGRTREGFKQASSFARFVHVFDWQGKFKRAYRLDSDILSVAVSPDRKWLYGIRHDPAPAIVVYPIVQ
jgi:hypothetical protein